MWFLAGKARRVPQLDKPRGVCGNCAHPCSCHVGAVWSAHSLEPTCLIYFIYFILSVLLCLDWLRFNLWTFAYDLLHLWHPHSCQPCALIDMPSRFATLHAQRSVLTCGCVALRSWRAHPRARLSSCMPDVVPEVCTGLGWRMCTSA